MPTLLVKNVGGVDRLRFSKGSERLEGMKMAKRLLRDSQPLLDR